MTWTDLVVLLAILYTACEHGARRAWRGGRFRFRSTPPPDDYANQLAAEHDLTPQQARRFATHNRLLNDDMDVGRLVAVRWAVRRGMVNEWPTSRLEEIEGF